jgi:hypothetical protein
MPKTPWQYLFVDTATLKFDLAIKACKENFGDGAWLADVRTEAEAIFISNFAPLRSIWVGIYDGKKEGAFVYDNDGADFTLKRWARGTVRVFRQNFTLEDAIGSSEQACDQCHSSRVSTLLTGLHCALRPHTEGQPDAGDWEEDPVNCNDDCVSINGGGGGPNEYSNALQTSYFFDNHCCRSLVYMCKRRDPEAATTTTSTATTNTQMDAMHARLTSLEELLTSAGETDIPTELAAIKGALELAVGALDEYGADIQTLKTKLQNAEDTLTKTKSKLTESNLAANTARTLLDGTVQNMLARMEQAAKVVPEFVLPVATECNVGEHVLWTSAVVY